MTASPASAAVTANQVEILVPNFVPGSQLSTDAEVTRQQVEFIVKNPAIRHARTTYQQVEVLFPSSNLATIPRVTHQHIETLVSNSVTGARATRQLIELLIGNLHPLPPDNLHLSSPVNGKILVEWDVPHGETVDHYEYRVCTSTDDFDAAVTQQAIEVLVQLSSSKAEVSRQAIEALVVNTAIVNKMAEVSRNMVEVLLKKNESTGFVSRQAVEVLLEKRVPGDLKSTHAIVSNAAVEVLMPVRDYTHGIRVFNGNVWERSEMLVWDGTNWVDPDDLAVEDDSGMESIP